MKMKSGKIFRITLRSDSAPLTVARFVRLARAGYYNGLSFHRVVPNFVIQGGSPGANEYSGDALYMRDEIMPPRMSEEPSACPPAALTPATPSSSSTW